MIPLCFNCFWNLSPEWNQVPNLFWKNWNILPENEWGRKKLNKYFLDWTFFLEILCIIFMLHFQLSDCSVSLECSCYCSNPWSVFLNSFIVGLKTLDIFPLKTASHRSFEPQQEPEGLLNICLLMLICLFIPSFIETLASVFSEEQIILSNILQETRYSYLTYR